MKTRKKSQKKKKESSTFSLKKKEKGRRLVQQIHVRETSEAEDTQIEQALDRLLRELVSQEYAQRRKS